MIKLDLRAIAVGGNRRISKIVADVISRGSDAVSGNRRSRNKRGIVVDGNRRAGAIADESTMTLSAPQSIKTMVISMGK